MGPTCEYLTNLLGFDKFLPSSSGVEACESACKLARRWGYVVKGVEQDKASILMANGCFWGRSITAASGSNDPIRTTNFGPFTPGFPLVNYNDVNAIQEYLEHDKNCVAVMLEPIQGEAGVIVPDKGYLKKVKDLCKKYNCLLITDEVQTGLGRTGKLMDYEWDLGEEKPDIVTLGKALSGGVTPVSGILANADIMDTINPGEHGSTFGGNSLGMAVAKAAVQAIVEEGMVENSLKMGTMLKSELEAINSPHIKELRGRGLLIAMQLNEDKGFMLENLLRQSGILTKPSNAKVIKFTPPLVITEAQVEESVNIFKKCLNDLN